MSITNATYTSPDWTGYKYPSSLAPLPDWMSRGLTAICAFSILSIITCLALLSYITYLLVKGGASYRAAVRKNQYVILIYSVLIADLQLSTGFLISIKWLHDDQMYAPSSACIAQACLTHVGDLASGLSGLAIAAHTFLAVVFGRKLEGYTFYSVVVGLWVLSILLTAIPVILHPADIIVVGGNWVTSSICY
jgi:G protein-coupled glucose receptor regulating Gpa2